MQLFKRQKPTVDREDPGVRRVVNTWDYVPASVRTPDENRLAATVFTSLEDEEETDEDIEFLRDLAGQVDGTPLRKAAPLTGALPSSGDASSRVAKREAVAASGGDGLELFRTVRVEETKTSVLATLRVDDVEIDDLMEDLSTTAAALRNRRAA